MRNVEEPVASSGEITPQIGVVAFAFGAASAHQGDAVAGPVLIRLLAALGISGPAARGRAPGPLPAGAGHRRGPGPRGTPAAREPARVGRLIQRRPVHGARAPPVLPRPAAPLRAPSRVRHAAAGPAHR